MLGSTYSGSDNLEGIPRPAEEQGKKYYSRYAGKFLQRGVHLDHE
jgi:hypothetical protein